MKIGLLNRQVTLQKPVATANTIGEQTSTWQDVATVWAYLEPATGSWYYAGMQRESKVDGRIHILYRNDIKSNWRVKYGDRYFIIVSLINSNEANRESIIMFREQLD
jgi:SPP1 family predicted phage head-tail adaptor